jgi:cellulose synthase/poly-beta-1,6-N-acetylglucosamine synthase-like glycosyltransferase
VPIDLEALLTAGLLFGTVSFAVAVGLIIVEKLCGLGSARWRALAVLAVNAGAFLTTRLLIPQSWDVLMPFAVALAMTVAARRMLRDLTVAGELLLATHAQLTLWSLAWGAWFIATIPVSTLTRAAMFAGYPFLALSIPVGLVETFEWWEVLCRRTWRRPRAPLRSVRRDDYPKVSLHVPAYSEPPEMVMATLDALARLKYPNFEVVVVDNNTKEPSLWLPVQAHCRRLGERFRFFHVEGLSGAKAGALNYALRHAAPDVDLVSVIDSDYQAEPDFLERLVGYFDDPQMGFVQTPHDYREWKTNPYLRMCYWEYKAFFETAMVSLNERDAAITVGTMCLIRREALEEAGGWAEWCVTEDSELAIRIHALGYSGVYLRTTFGRGLIPETFSGYKQQRFRWTYGPIQELKHHIRLFLPWPLGRPSCLSVVQKVHHLNHGLREFKHGLGLLLLPFAVAVVASMVLNREVVAVPWVLWVALSIGVTTGFALTWLTFRVVMGCSLAETLGAVVASKALNHTRTVASFWGLFTRRIAWRRTNKFKALPLGLGALRSTRAELLLGLAAWAFVGGSFAALPRSSGLALLVLIGGLVQSLDYFAAPALSLLAEREIRSREKMEHAARARPPCARMSETDLPRRWR